MYWRCPDPVEDAMKISRSEYNMFCAEYARGAYTGQRFGQAWYNHFKMHAHNATGEDRVRLDKLYNERVENIARVTILNYYLDEMQ